MNSLFGKRAPVKRSIGKRSIGKRSIGKRALAAVFAALFALTASAGASAGTALSAVTSRSNGTAMAVGEKPSKPAASRAAIDGPTKKTPLTLDCEAAIKRLQSEEKGIKASIKAATINRSKILAAKRAELKAARAARDKKIKAEIDALKAKKDKQTSIIRGLKTALSAAKKLKNALAVAAADAAVKIAQMELEKINEEYKEAKNRLSDSYKLYKTQYDNLTETDKVLRDDQLAKADAEKQNLTALRDDYKEANAEYKDCVRAKDFTHAQALARSALAAQERINVSQNKILGHLVKFKEQYYAGIANRPVT